MNLPMFAMVERDVLLFGAGSSERQRDLFKWADNEDELHEFVPDFHRLQLEHWLWSRRHLLGHRVMDVGVENRRDWVGPGYFTLGFQDCDLAGDLLNVPLADESVDGVILTEVLEHCTDPFRAVREIHRVMRPVSMALVTSPIIWPWHGTTDYPDYWRFTDEAWRLLLKDFSSVVIEPCEWTTEGEALYSLLRRFECMGWESFGKATTGYLVEATK